MVAARAGDVVAARTRQVEIVSIAGVVSHVNLLNNVNLLAFVQQLAGQLREYAKDAGTACSLPECTALTLGVRCDGCLRRTCTSHTYWKLSPKPSPCCPYCVLSAHPDLFFEGPRGDTADGDVIDADPE